MKMSLKRWLVAGLPILALVIVGMLLWLPAFGLLVTLRWVERGIVWLVGPVEPAATEAPAAPAAPPSEASWG
jgi:hypothetical protein